MFDKFLKNKKGFGINELAPAAMSIIVIVVLVAVGAMVLGEMNSTTDNTDAQNVIGKGVEAMTTFGDWLPILVIVIISAIVIGIVTVVYRRV